MYWKSRSWILIGVLLAAFTVGAHAQIVTTQVADTVYHADGTPATGTALVSWPAFTTANGDAIPAGSISAAIVAGGALSVQLIPDAGATPIGSYYTVVYHLDDGRVSRQYWIVPASATPVKVSAIESTVLPTSVAMQTVSKNYVDTAIAAAVTGHPLDSTPLVLKTGDTMTGPLVLPANPVAANQAADKNYVDESVAAVAGSVGQMVSVAGDIGGTASAPVVTGIRGNPVSTTAPATGQTLTWNGSAYAPATPPSIPGLSPDGSNGIAVTGNVAAAQVKATGAGVTPSYVNGNNCQYDLYHQSCNVDLSIFVSPSATSSQNAHDRTMFVAGPGSNSDGVSGQTINPPWTQDMFDSTLIYSMRRGLHQREGVNYYCLAVGDCTDHYTYMFGVGGLFNPDDEGRGGSMYAMTETNYFKGTVNAGAVVQNGPAMTASPGAGPYEDGLILIDTTQGTISGNFAGNATPVTGGEGLYYVPVSGVTLPLTTAWAQCNQADGNILPNTNRATPVTVTLTCTNMPIPGYGTPALAANTYTWVTGNYPEQAKLATVVSQSGTTEVVTIPLTNPNGAGVTTLWQGPLVGQFCSVDDDLTYSGQRPLFDAYGSLTGTDLINGIRANGSVFVQTMPRVTGDSFETTTSSFHCYPGAEVVQNRAFTGATTAGSPVITNVAGIANLAVGNPITGLQLTSQMNANYFFAAGTVITAIDTVHNTVTVSNSSTGTTPANQPFVWSAGVQVEPHSFTLAAGDSVEMPHPMSVALESVYGGRVGWNTPGSGYNSSTFAGWQLSGTNIGSSFRPFHIWNTNPNSMYTHGLHAPAGIFRYEGPMSQFINIGNAPLCGNPNNSNCALMNVEGSGLPVTGTTNGTTTLTLSATAYQGITVGSYVLAVDIPANTTITAVSGSTLTLSAAATGSNTNESVTIFPTFNLWSLPGVNSGSEQPFATVASYNAYTKTINYNNPVTFGGVAPFPSTNQCCGIGVTLVGGRSYLYEGVGIALHNEYSTPISYAENDCCGVAPSFAIRDWNGKPALALQSDGGATTYGLLTVNSANNHPSIAASTPGAADGYLDMKQITAQQYLGPATAPTGSCTGLNGVWVFSQDGHATFCAAGTWTTKI